MDIARRTFRTKMRFDPTSRVATSVDWFVCNPEARPLPFPTSFGSSEWHTVTETLNTVIGEIPGNRTWLSRRPVPPLHKLPCGDPQAFIEGAKPGTILTGSLGIGGRALSRNPSGLPECCGLELRDRVLGTAGRAFISSFSLGIGGRAIV